MENFKILGSKKINGVWYQGWITYVNGHQVGFERI